MLRGRLAAALFAAVIILLMIAPTLWASTDATGPGIGIGAAAGSGINASDNGVGTQISGVVQGSNEGTVILSGATVTVRLDAADPNFDGGNVANNLVGTATADSNGNYAIDVSAFRSTGLPIGSIVDVTASVSGYLSVMQFGEFDRANVVCSFQNFNALFGAPWEDRRLPYNTGQIPPLPFEFLLPNYVTPLPTVTGVSPNSGTTLGGTSVTITGTNFVAGATVTFGGTDATGVSVVSPTSITCATPPHAVGAVDVVVTTSGGPGTLDRRHRPRPRRRHRLRGGYHPRRERQPQS